MQTDTEKITSTLLQQNFDLQEFEEGDGSFHKMRWLLVQKIDFLLDNDFEKLLQLLYRIDVDENKAKTALAKKADLKPSEVLADLVIDRMMEKAKSRISMTTHPHTGDLKE
ncbi:MAG TPA: hypothetical protein PLD84_06595 [Chitinophagales bacterium]|nr:hypothetical protein [Chitinophagales bacterium]